MTIAVNPAQTGEPVFYIADEHPHPEGYSTSLGFWIYLMSDCLIFAMLFAAFAVLVDFVEKEYPGYVDWEYTDEMRAQRDEILALHRWWTKDRADERDADDGSTDAMDDKDDAMLLRLMAVRGILWT